jgi:hypothetical protein
MISVWELTDDKINSPYVFILVVELNPISNNHEINT